MTRLLLPLAFSALCPALSLASGANKHTHEGIVFLPGGGFTYEVFEASIDHADLEDCPVDFDSDANFCRLTLANEQAHVFVFSYDGDQPLLAVKSYDLGDGFLPF